MHMQYLLDNLVLVDTRSFQLLDSNTQIAQAKKYRLIALHALMQEAAQLSHSYPYDCFFTQVCSSIYFVIYKNKNHLSKFE